MMGWVRGWLASRKPRVFENNRIPVWLSKIAPIEIGAISLVGFIFCRGKISKTQLRHETIHFHQQIELFFLGFFLLYVFFWLIGLIRYRSAGKAYRENPFEREAYSNERKYTYLEKRSLWNWTNYIRG
jgi:hypothetical protein